MMENNNELKPIKSVIVTTNDLINVLASKISDPYRNTIYIHRTKQLIMFSTITYILDNEEHYIDCDSDLEILKKASMTINRASRITIVPMESPNVLTLDNKDIVGLGGVKLLCFKEIAIEYLKNKLYENIYSDSELLYLCKENPTIPNSVIDTVNVMDILDIHPSEYLSCDDQEYMDLIINSDLKSLYDEYVGSVRRILSEFPKHPKEVLIRNRCVIVNIYTDIRIIRFYEMTEYMKGIEYDKSEDEFSETVDETTYNHRCNK